MEPNKSKIESYNSCIVSMGSEITTDPSMDLLHIDTAIKSKILSLICLVCDHSSGHTLQWSDPTAAIPQARDGGSLEATINLITN
jgi:hypothetical protein